MPVIRIRAILAVGTRGAMGCALCCVHYALHPQMECER